MSLTQKDKQEIGDLISENNRVLLESVDNVVKEAKKETINKLQEYQDVIVKEIKTSQNARTVQSHQIKRNTNRIEKLETRVFKN